MFVIVLKRRITCVAILINIPNFGKFTVFNILIHRLGNAAAILGWLGQVFLVLYGYLITELLKPLELERKRTVANLRSMKFMGLYRK